MQTYLSMLNHTRLALASKSPRRHALLKLLNLPFTVVAVDADERFDSSLSPAEVVTTLSERKARLAQTVHSIEHAVVLGADTVVVIDQLILNKPANEAEAFSMLSMLQGRTHSVYTGFTLLDGDVQLSDYEKTDVSFSPMTDDEIRFYIHTAKPFDKAGGYGIQDDLGACFIDRIDGCYYNVVGLPIAKLYQSLKRFEALRHRHSKLTT